MGVFDFFFQHIKIWMMEKKKHHHHHHQLSRIAAADVAESPRSVHFDDTDADSCCYFTPSSDVSSDVDSVSSPCRWTPPPTPDYHHHHQEQSQPLDFENNHLIWNLPPPLDDDETALSSDDDEDDDDGFVGKSEFAMMSVRGSNKDGLRDAVRGHFRALAAQLLRAEGVSCDEWLEVVTSLAWQAATFVRLDTNRGGSMDPGSYVKVKCVASGKPIDSVFVKGVVCTKNVRHKRMILQHKNPRLFLLSGALEYQKVPNRLASINTVIEQESDHVKLSVAKIEAHRPNVLLVEKSVSSFAQEYLMANEISLVLNVKKKLLERIARCTGAQIAPSVDDIALARLGHCEMFRVEKLAENCPTSENPNKKSTKTLMFFEGCPRRLGCTVLLRGAHEELRKVKHVVQYASFAAYHLSRETSFLADEGATLPTVPPACPISVPANLANHDTCISKTSDIVNAERKNLKICVNNPENCFLSCPDKSSPDGDMLSDMSCLSPSNSEIDGDHSIGLMDYFEQSCSPTINGPQQELVENSFEEGRFVTTKVDDKKITNINGNQGILVSLSTTSVLKGTICEPSQLIRIKFYGSCDKPLGRYLRDDLFDQETCCRSCKDPPEAHVRCYTHQHGSLTISVRRHPSIKLPGERDGRIWMWHRCLKCEQKDGLPPAARRVIMSDAAWALSFGKFLELSFSNHATANRIASCGHSLQKDCLRFYGFGNMIAFFRYGPVEILSIKLPPLVLDFTCQVQQEWAKKEADAISRKKELLHFEVLAVLERIEQKITASDMSIRNYITELKSLLEREKQQYDVLLQLPGSDDMHGYREPLDILELNRLRRYLLIDSQAWDRRLCFLHSFSRSDTGEVIAHSRLNEISDESRCSPQEILTKSSTMPKKYEETNYHAFNCDANHMVDMDWSIDNAEAYMGITGLNLISGNSSYLSDSESPKCVEASTVTSLERLPSAASTLSDKIDSLWSGNPEVDPIGTISSMDNPLYRKVLTPVRVNSFDSGLRVRDRLNGRLTPASLHLSSVRSFDVSSSVRMSNPLPSHNPVFVTSSAHMVDEGARLLLPQTDYDDLVIVLYDNEPTTIISYAISSQEHADFIDTKFDNFYESGRINRPSLDDESQRVRRSLDNKETHLRISFDDESSIPADKVKFSVTCYFAKQFDELRKKCCADEADFLRSLSRCKTWNAQGGKSNVYFAKTLDERFVIKQVTKTELDSFEYFAAEYFKYLTESVSSGSPTCLAKILGIYQVTVKHLKGGREMKLDLMVMENLFFGRKLSRVYDLKGSSRSRYNPNTSGDDKVLLDLNLLETLRTKPIFLGSKAKRSLERAVWNDTSFLASVDVMDYSLLVGVDDERKELVVGIIDFMRQYTWDKHLETWVKSGILGGSKNASPTIVSPLQYKKRFRKAMSKYFLTVPDQWQAS